MSPAETSSRGTWLQGPPNAEGDQQDGQGWTAKEDEKLQKQFCSAVAAGTLNAPLRVRALRNKRAQSDNTLHQFHALPDYLQDNEFIRGHYRRIMPMRDSIWSLFGLHNETGNIYTHLLGFLLFASLTVLVARQPPTPLAIGSKQVDMLWGAVRGRLQQLPGNFTVTELVPDLPGLHLLQSTLGNLSESIHCIHEGLVQKAHELQEGLSETMHHLQEGVSGTVGSMQECLSEGLHRVQEGLHLHHSAQQLSEEAAAKLQLVEALSGDLSWPAPRWPVYVFMAGAMTCLLLSSICHLLGCCQRHITQYVWRLDYAGISALIVSSFYPLVYYGFLCRPAWLGFYLATTTTMGLMAVMMSLLNKFQKSQWRPFRAAMFAALGLYGTVPIIHLWLLSDDMPQVKRALAYDVIMGATYLSGAAIYAMRIPERWFPGRFDLFFSSHQIFHVAVVAGAFIHYYSVKLMLEWRDASGGCALPVTSGHVSSVLQQMQELGHDLFSIEEVWNRLQRYMHAHLNSSGGVGGAAAAASMAAGEL